MTLLEEWREFERNIVPADVDQIMRSKMRFLFYSGALCVFDRFTVDRSGTGQACGIAQPTARVSQ